MLTKLKEQPAKLDAPELQVLLRDNLLRSISKKLFNNLHSIRVLDLRTEINSLLKNVRDIKSLSV